MTRLDIVSDVVCPWCYLGKANLERALAQRPEHRFDIRWRPFQLDPTIPPEGRDREAYLTAKFGKGGVYAAHARLTQMGEEAGVHFHFDRITRAPNTLDAHRLIRWAEASGAQNAAKGELMRRYFELGEDISDPAVLVAAAEAVGMDGPVVARLLAGDADRAEVKAEIAQAAKMGVTGVPTFVLGGGYALSGAQPVEVWTRVIDELEAASS